MFRNLLTLLFLFALALPAMAVPAPAADSTITMAEDCHGMPMEHDKETPADSHAVQHGCIGCIAPYVPVIIVAEATQVVTPARPANVRELAGHAPKPRDPPPRS